jgi:N-acetylglucosaminyldiphosphoundecaprenol N-acetyl-beta-D-mannosaminyltransferase
MNTVRVLNTDITDTTINDVSNLLNNSSGNTVAICNANTLVQCVKNNDINSIINSFTIASPDGFPVAKAISKLAKKNIKRVDGYKVFKQTIEDGLEKNTSHYFFGSNESVVSRMINNLKSEYPSINILGYTCPPIEDVDDLVNTFTNSLLKNISIQSNFIGVGAVFEWVAGTKLKAPEWMANIGLEWVLRLVQEPRRLFKRYLVDNTLFVYYLTKQLLSKN